MEHASRALLAAILASAVDAIVVIDEWGIIQSANSGTEALFGYSEDELVGANVSQLLPEPVGPHRHGDLWRGRRTDERRTVGVGREETAQRRDGTQFPVHVVVSECRVGDRRLLTGIIRDISDLKEVECRLKEWNEVLEERGRERTQELREMQAELVRKEKLALLGQVSAGIAHEIRNPLNALKTSAYFLLRAQEVSVEKMREHLERIDRQVTRIDDVVTALTDIAMLPEPKSSVCDIRPILQAAMQGIVLHRSIKVKVRFSENIPAVLIDENQMPIVFRNLIRNAREAMPEGGTLTVSTALLQGQVAIHIEDTGIGISEQDLPRLTEPFFTKKANGMGLGLAISKAIIDNNGGRLDVDSKPGKGTRFSVILRGALEKAF